CHQQSRFCTQRVPIGSIDVLTPIVKNMREVELKIFLSDDDRSKLLKWLKDSAKYVGDENHQEIYFDNPNSSFLFESFDGLQDAEKYLRVRKTKEGESVCLKIFEIDKENCKSRNLD